MLILSQDKSEVFNFSEIFRLWVDTWSSKEFATEPDCWCIRAEKASDNMICAFLGEYATEERAKEVLREIISMYQGSLLLQYTNNKAQEDIAKLFKDMDITPFKFEMPQE